MTICICGAMMYRILWPTGINDLNEYEVTTMYKSYTEKYFVYDQEEPGARLSCFFSNKSIQ